MTFTAFWESFKETVALFHEGGKEGIKNVNILHESDNECSSSSIDLSFTPEYDDIHNQAHFDSNPHHPTYNN